MAETTNISWADATLNFWAGCTKVSTGADGACEFCYAETWANRFPRYRGTWGVGAPRVRMLHCLAKAKKLERLAIDKAARGEGAFFCFSNSLSDIFDNEVPIEWLAEAFAVMRATPHVTYLLLTKRAPNIVKRSEAAGGLPPNAALGITVVTQIEFQRDTPTLAAAAQLLHPALTFLSMEPLMELVNMELLQICKLSTGQMLPALHFIDWVITGGESGAHARPAPPSWFRNLRDQCARAAVPFHFKQWGEIAPPQTDEDRARFADGHGFWGALGGAGKFVDQGNGIIKIGKERAGRLLDGVEHNARPLVAA